MPPKIEKLDANNIIEIKQIRHILKDKPDLLAVFRLIIINNNNILNDKRLDTEIEAMVIDEDEEYVSLSDHSSDEEIYE